MSRLARFKEHSQAFVDKLKEVDPRGALALTSAVGRFVSDRVTPERAVRESQASIEGRGEAFLDLARTRIYAWPESPYLKLLKLAGCAYADLEAGVRRDGLEPTLENLAGEGVYLTTEEWKGKKAVVRGGESFWMSPGDLANAASSRGIVTESSGSRNRPQQTAASLKHLAAGMPARGVFLAAHNLFSYSHAVYDAILPAGGGVRNILGNAQLGLSTDRWFARDVGNATIASWYYYLLTYVIVAAARRFGSRLPAPEFLEAENVERIVSWVKEERRRGKRCCITTTASNAMRIARHAFEAGESLEGTRFVASGEPLTPTKRELIERAGAYAIPNYGSEDIWAKVGWGCPASVHDDEMHVNQQMLTTVVPREPLDFQGRSIRPLLFTSLKLGPRLFFNAANGDYATLFRRDCGCLLEKTGFTLHIHSVRSYEKFTSEGMNYFYGDLFELFEKILPAEFGGGPGDYQLVEEEDAHGQTRLTLLVHPAVGEVDEARLIARLKESLAQGQNGGRFMSGVWQGAGTFRVVRQPPRASARGKILPLHISR